MHRAGEYYPAGNRKAEVMQHRIYATVPNRATVAEERVLRTEDLTDPALKRFDAIWRMRCEGRLPGASDVDPSEIADLLSNVLLVDVVRDGGAVRFATRLVGQHHVDLFGRAGAANFLSDGRDHSDHLRDVISLALPVYTRGRVDGSAKGAASFERVSYPLASDGYEVDQVISVVSPHYARPARMASIFSWF